MPRFRFRLRSLFWITAAVAVIVYIPSALYDGYYWQLRHVNAVLTSNQYIENVHMTGNDDIFYEVEWIEFSIAGNPTSHVGIVVPHQERIDDGTELLLSKLGPWQFHVIGNGIVGTRYDTGEPVKGDFHWRYIDLGNAGAFKSAIPIKANTINDIVENYDKLVAYFETWPEKKSPGIVQDRSGMILHYYVERISH